MPLSGCKGVLTLAYCWPFSQRAEHINFRALPAAHRNASQRGEQHCQQGAAKPQLGCPRRISSTTGRSVDGLALMAARTAVERAAIACARPGWTATTGSVAGSAECGHACAASVELEAAPPTSPGRTAWVVAPTAAIVSNGNGAAVAAPVVAHAGSVRAVARSGHRTVASTGDDGVLRRWDLREGSQLVHEHHGHVDACCAIAWWDATDTLASGGRDCTVRIWDGRAPRAAAMATFGSDVRALAAAGHAGIGVVVGLGGGRSSSGTSGRARSRPGVDVSLRARRGGEPRRVHWVDRRVARAPTTGRRLVYVDAPAVGGHGLRAPVLDRRVNARLGRAGDAVEVEGKLCLVAP